MPVSNDPYTVSGCNVEINLTKAEAGQTLADLVAIAKTAMTTADPKQTNICTLTVTGELSANDLTVALSSSNMASATRIDLSGATLASGVSLTSLNIPSSLTSLVLPKDQTVSVGLASKLADATYLMYAYSPSSDCTATGPNQADEKNQSTYKYDDSKNTIADYVWVNKAGGLAQALENEEQLRNSFYIKVASGVALTATDINFGALTNKPTNYLFLDLSESIMTPTVADSYTVEDDIPYRIILPNNWSNADLAHFQNNAKKGNLAAVYSYEDTKLNILVIEDNSYWGTALQNPRIVRTGTNAIDILPGAYTNNHEFGTATTEGRGIITAINNANESIKSVYISIANTGNNAGTTYTIANSNITYLSFEGIKSAYNGGPTVNVTGCSSLQTLNLKDAILSGVIANGITSLTTVDMTGTTNSGTTNLSGTGLRTFTTNSSTKLQGDINLMSTALTSLNTTAEIGTTTGGTGNILLNGCESLASITLGSAQFKNETSMIHIDKNTTENNDAIDALSRTETVGESQVAVKTIFVPNGFTSSSRIHPYEEVQNNVSEVAGSSANEDGDKCSITYDATTKVATVHTNEPGHFATMMETRYGNYPLGATFKFDATSKINMADLQALAGKINANDYSWRSNYYYVDLFDIKADKTTCDNTTGAIGKAIEWMRDNDRQFKGLILPKNHTQYGSGTTLIEDAANAETPVATCSEFIAYYKTKEENGSDATKKMTVAHVYNQSNSSDSYQASFDKMSSLLRLHDDVTGAEGGTGTDVFLVTTNSINKLNIDNMVANASSIEVVNNEMVASTKTDASIYAYPKTAGDFTVAVTASGLYNTPTELLKIEGPISSGIATALNKFTNGPRVLDLKNIAREQATDAFISTLLAALTNSKIEYIILPEGMQKSTVCRTYSSSMTSLKAVISSSATNLVAHVQQPGSLAEARYLATGGSIPTETGLISPTITGLTSVTLSGNLNASDIFANDTGHKVDNNGHWTTTGSNAKPMALSGEQGTITTIDLKDAVFPTQTDMNFSYAGLSSLTDVKLPIASTMDKLPEDCLNNIETLKQLCIPSNYKVIEKNALFLCGALTIITDNDAHTLYIGKNGESFLTEADAFTASYDTYTLSKNITNIATGSFNTRSISLSDIYVMATTTPNCEKDAFAEGMYVGWKGFTGGDYPYCREKYRNNLHLYTILHYPAKSNTNLTDADYEAMEKNYTDVTKIYTKKEQTGAKDANGREIVWPTFPELRRVFAQASDGLTWYDWPTAYTTDPQYAVNEIASLQDQYKDYQEADASKTYDFNDYIGWHQFVLTMASNYQPSEEVVNNKIDRRYVDAGYYTFCIPFDMTLEEVIELMGVPASDNTYNNYLGSSETPVTESIVPEIYQLNLVTRKWANTSITNDKNVVKLILTENLYNATSKETSYLDFASSVEGGVINITKSLVTLPDGVCLKGGRPYIIKAYKRQGKTIKSRNLGQFIMNEYGNKFKLAASCVHNCFEQLGSGSLKTLRFAKPYENHKVQAMMDSEYGSLLTYNEDDKEKKYYYTMIGQFWTQKLPLYCIYMSGNNHWYRYDQDEGYNWQAYKCVIMASKEGTDNTVAHYGGGYRQAEGDYTHYPTVKENTTDQLDNSFKLGFLDGRNDDDFDTATNPVGTRYIFAFDDGIVELDEEGNEVTAIEELDGEIVAPLKDDNRVYNMQGQYVGQMNNSLGKGMYIVNGKKIVVK